jgi:ABC-2 type transport system ATP-binding protein
VISVRDLTRSFGATTAVSGLSFELAAGEVVGFLGRNGAGKTTTMRVITGYLAPTSGTVAVAGHDVVDEPLAARAALGYLPETPPLYPEMIVAAYLRFCGRLRGLGGRALQARVEQVIERCGLARVSGRICGNLSRGFRQRVGLAQALVHDPAVLVLDEPTTALDPGQIKEIRDLLRALTVESAGPAGRRTVILSTHRLEDVTATCDRVIVISRGRLVADEAIGPELTTDELERRFLALTSGEEEAA